MYRTNRYRAGGLFVAGVLLLAGCGSDTPIEIEFSVRGVAPQVSSDLNGGDLVVVTGTNFQTAGVSTVYFETTPGTGLRIIDEEHLEILTPPAPGRQPMTVALRVYATNVENPGNPEILYNAYTYTGGPPQPQTILPTSFTPTGAESFTIQGSSLGPASGSVEVQFLGVGSVTGQVSPDGTIVTGRAPLAGGLPAPASIVVRVVNGSESGDVPTAVSYDWSQPIAHSVPGLTASAASKPVRLSSGAALVSTAGPDGAWGNVDDAVVLIPKTGLPMPIAVGHLDANNSNPVVLDATTFCVLSTGPNGTFGNGDDLVVQVSVAQSPPAVALFRYPNMNAAPLAPVSSTVVAFTDLGADTTAVTVDDRLVVYRFVAGGPPLPIWYTLGFADATPGPANFSVPYSPDGDNVYAVSVGPDGVGGTSDDRIGRVRISTLATRSTLAPFLLRPPLGVGSGLLVVPAGNNAPPGGVGDALATFTDTGTGLTYALSSFNAPTQVGALAPFVPAGSGGIAVALRAGATNSQLRVFTDPALGTFSNLAIPTGPLLASLGSGDMLVISASGALWVKGDATDSRGFSQAPAWNRALVPASDNDRVFAVGPGTGGYGTGDEPLLVYQTRALGAVTDAVVLPLSQVASDRLTGNEAFVPIGPDWGVILSPGTNGVYGLGIAGSDDMILVARY